MSVDVYFLCVTDTLVRFSVGPFGVDNSWNERQGLVRLVSELRFRDEMNLRV